MKLLSKIALAAGLAALSATAVTPVAAASSAERGYSYDHRYDRGHYRPYRHRLQGHFLVYVRDCPDLREDRRDRRVDNGRADRREDRRDRRVIDCPSRAFEYVPSRRELRRGRTGERLRINTAFWDRETRTYYADTRFGSVPVYIQRGRAPHNRGHYRDRRGRGYDRW